MRVIGEHTQPGEVLDCGLDVVLFHDLNKGTVESLHVFLIIERYSF